LAVFRIGAGQLLPCLLRRELPFDARARRIALALPCRNFRVEDRAITDAPIQGHNLPELIQIIYILWGSAQFSCADRILTELAKRHPRDYPVRKLHGLSMFQSRDWPQATVRWLAIKEDFPDDWSVVIDMANTYRAPALFAEADAVLREGMGRFPHEIAILRQFTGLAIQQGNFDEALARSKLIRDRFPDNPDGYAVAGEALQMLGRFEEAADLLSSVGDKFNDDWTATRRRRWEEAFEQWDSMLNRFPPIGELTGSVGDAIGLWQIAKSEGDEAAIAASLPPEVARRAGVAADEAGLSDHDLMMGFEGLGDACEAAKL
jgi:tetratricopeptide (TPR) repeat protein